MATIKKGNLLLVCSQIFLLLISDCSFSFFFHHILSILYLFLCLLFFFLYDIQACHSVLIASLFSISFFSHLSFPFSFYSFTVCTFRVISIEAGVLYSLVPDFESTEAQKA